MRSKNHPENKISSPKKAASGKWVLLALLALGIAFFFYFDLGQYFTLQALKENKDALQDYAKAHYGLSAVLFVSLYCLQTTLSLPGATILTLAGGFLFGTWMGGFLVNIGATSGAVLAFMAARYLLREGIERKFGSKLSAIQEGFSQDGFSYLLTLRLIPLFPFFLVNLASGLTHIRLSHYTLATAIGILPGSLVYSNAGAQLGQIASLSDIASPGVIGAFTLLGLLALVPVFYNKMKKPPKSKPRTKPQHLAT